MPMQSTLAAQQLELFRDGTFSDLKVVCGDRSWKCHRSVLCPRCPFFEAACKGNFKESKTLTVKLNDDPPEGVDVLLEYLYTLGQPDFKTSDGKSLTRAEHAFVLGDKYGLPELSLCGRKKLEECIQDDFKYWDQKSEPQKKSMISLINKIWLCKQVEADVLRSFVLQRLSIMTVSMVDDEMFTAMLWGNKDFGKAFFRHLFVMKTALKGRPY